jgi:hypothetical protein
MQANLARVFSERDAARRMEAIAELYVDDATLHELHASVTGHAAISRAVATLLSSLPPSFIFTVMGPAVGHHDVARLHWRAGPPNGPVTGTATDAARFEDGRIQVLHVFLDPPAPEPSSLQLLEFTCPRTADWAREKTAQALGGLILEHAGGSGIALAWKMQLLAGRTGAGV